MLARALGSERRPPPEASGAAAKRRRLEAAGSRGLGQRRRAASSWAEDEPRGRSGGSSSSRPAKEEHPALVAFSKLTGPQRLRQFWTFVIEACRGQSSDEAFCRQFELGGLLPFIADVNTVAREILLPFSHDVGEQLWRTFVVVWLGAGGPGMATYRHVAKGCKLAGESCPPEARLPRLKSQTDVLGMYRHLAAMVRRHGRSTVISGDGSSVKFRFEPQQGVEVLRSWRRCVVDLMERAGGTAAGLAAMGPRAIFEHTSRYQWIGALTGKELACYLYAAHPRAFDTNTYVPVGSGAMRGGRLVLGKRPRQSVDWHQEFRKMAEGMPEDLAKELKKVVHKRRKELDTDDERLPGVRQQLTSGRPTAGDVEVCMCLFQNFLKAKWSGSAPAGWRMLDRSLWRHLRG